jgi:O-antigen/teichoic acid export membrane protein
MKSLIIFLNDFFKNKGHHVFVSLLVAKICGFLGSLFIIRILPENEFGTLSIVASVFFVFLSFSGLGSQQILLRYGSVTQDLEEKKALSKYLLQKGFLYQVFLSLIFLCISLFYINTYDNIFYIFLLFTIRLFGCYFLIFIQSELRISGNNKGFSTLSNVVNILGVILLVVLSYYFGLTGYLFAIAFSPFIALFWINKEYYTSATKDFSFGKKEIWNYGIMAAGCDFLSDMLFSADILILSFLMNESAVANYKVALLIPSNIVFLSATLMQSDYPKLTKFCRDKKFLENYVLNYYKIFIPVSILIFLGGFFFKAQILNFFFGVKYQGNEIVFLVFLGIFSVNMLLRNLYGNLLSAMGLMKFSTYISALNILLLVIFAFIFVGRLGILGMAISLSLSMLICGVILLIGFYQYWKSLK